MHLTLPLRCERKHQNHRYSIQVRARLKVNTEFLRKIQVMNANPLTHPVTFCQLPKINCAEFLSSTGVVAVSAANVAMMIAKLAKINKFCNLARIRVAELPRSP